MSWTNYDDVADRWVGGSLPANESQVTTLISDAEDTILRFAPDMQTRIDDGAIPEDRVKKVAAWMVIRHLRNPTGQRSTTQGAGPFQQSVTFGGDEPGSMYLTAEEMKELGGAGKNTGAFSLDLTPTTATPNGYDGGLPYGGYAFDREWNGYPNSWRRIR